MFAISPAIAPAFTSLPKDPVHAVPGQANGTTDIPGALDRVRNAERVVPVFPARVRRPDNPAVAHAGIHVTGSEIPLESRSALARTHGVAITPLVVAGKEIGYRIGSQGASLDTALVCCHGGGMGQGTFAKPAGVELRFAVPGNTALRSAPLVFAERLRLGELRFDDESQFHGNADTRRLVDYTLGGGMRTTAQDIAGFLGRAGKAGLAIPFDFLVINRNAHGVCFSDLLEAVRLADGQPLTTLVCHFCRSHDYDYAVFDALRS